MSSCLARAIFSASSRSTSASTMRLGHIRACASNSLCLDCPRLAVGSWHSQSSMACITTTEGRRDAARAVWMEKVASTPLWATTVRTLRRLLDERGPQSQSDDRIFRNAQGGSLTRFGIDYILKKNVAAAASRVPSLKRQRVSPHVVEARRGPPRLA